jgi:glucosamine--fructose-6-phosphate aminotransferase (isomerizing)
MCGIMGYVGDRSARDIVYAGLKRLEYRGYDSVGIAVLNSQLKVTKAIGDTAQLDISSLAAHAPVAIGHTRWATHGKPSVANAHPHTFGRVTLVHNGIIENYQELMLTIDTAGLQSETDSEVLAALIDSHFVGERSLLEAVQLALAQVKGTFGSAVISPAAPGEIVVARRGSPIVIGVANDQYFVASDPTAIIDYTDKVVYLKDDQIARITASSLDIYDLKLQHQATDIDQLDGLLGQAELGSYQTYLEKEIFEQPSALRDLMRGRVGSDGSIVLGGPNLSQADIEGIRQIIIIGCGTSYYAGLYAKYQLEEILGIPVSVEQASEFRYRYGAYDPASTLAILMSQSGETADVMGSLKEAKRRHIKTLGVVNVVGSSLAREVENGGIYLHAGTEVSVASTKAYSSMVSALLMLAGFFAYRLGRNPGLTRELAAELLALPDEVTGALELKQQIDKFAAELAQYHEWFYLGRHTLYPVALEGALKLTEVANVHAQGLPMGEMKHGPIALVNQQHLSVILLPEDELRYDKGISALQEIKARNGRVLTISTRPKPRGSEYHLEITHVGDHVDGLIYNVCLQLLALAVATERGVNIDRPQNLAKSVTVE